MRNMINLSLESATCSWLPEWLWVVMTSATWIILKQTQRRITRLKFNKIHIGYILVDTKISISWSDSGLLTFSYHDLNSLAQFHFRVQNIFAFYPIYLHWVQVIRVIPCIRRRSIFTGIEYRVCWWLGTTRIWGISSHDIDLGNPGYAALCAIRFNKLCISHDTLFVENAAVVHDVNFQHRYFTKTEEIIIAYSLSFPSN